MEAPGPEGFPGSGFYGLDKFRAFVGQEAADREIDAATIGHHHEGLAVDLIETELSSSSIGERRPSQHTV